MRANKINSIEDALKLFEESTSKRGDALDANDIKTYNKYLPAVNKCVIYLYEHHQLQLLYQFLSHDNYLVRSTAAYVLLPLYEKECIKVLSEIINGDYGAQSLNVERILMRWGDGDLVFPYQSEYNKKPVPPKEYKPSEKANEVEETAERKKNSPDTLRLSQIFECPPTGDHELFNDEAGFYVLADPESHEVAIRVNTFVNPYTQDVAAVYQKRIERFKIFAGDVTISADKPSKLGFMQIKLTIPESRATDDVLTRIKETVYAINSEWKPDYTLVWLKADYHGNSCYFEGEWWMPTRAVIKNGDKYERYDFSDEMKFDEQMWEIVQGEYDELEDSDSFALITSTEFQKIWDATEHDYEPEPF